MFEPVGAARQRRTPPRPFDAKGSRPRPDDAVDGSGPSIDRRHLLLVGAGLCLGMAMARRFAEGGYRVSLVDRGTDGRLALADTGVQIATAGQMTATPKV